MKNDSLLKQFQKTRLQPKQLSIITGGKIVCTTYENNDGCTQINKYNDTSSGATWVDGYSDVNS